MSDDYAIRQAQRDRDYREAYQSPEVKAWVESLTPAERKRAQAEGLISPLVFGRASGQSEKDLADSSLASENPDIIESFEPEIPAPQKVNGTETSDALASFCARIRSVTNPLLVFDAVCFATGVMALDGESQTALARRHGVSRSAFSKLAIKWCKTFGLKPSRGMKSQKARETYSQLTRAKWHERNRRQSR